MKLQNLSDEQILSGTLKWAKHEREGLHGVLHHLCEVERRRLYSHLKYPSLFAYVVNELKYSEDAAVRRISAMRLMTELPQIEDKIIAGSLTLTNLGMVKKLFVKKKHSATDKLRVLNQIENKSTREAHKIVCDILPELKRREVGYHDFDDDLKAKLEKVRGMVAHNEGELTLVQLLHKLCDEKLAQDLPAAPRVKRFVREKMRNQGHVRLTKNPRTEPKCSNCESTHALEVDHIIPRGLGGSDRPENLRLLCRACNQRAAIVSYGSKVMGRYLKSPARSYLATLDPGSNGGNLCGDGRHCGIDYSCARTKFETLEVKPWGIRMR